MQRTELVSRPPREGGLVGLADFATEPNHLYNARRCLQCALNRRSRARMGELLSSELHRVFLPGGSNVRPCLPISNTYCILLSSK